MSDPTDNALAAIASILDQTTTPPDTAKSSEKDKSSETDKSSDKPADKASEDVEAPPVSIAMPPPLPLSATVASIEAVSVESAPAEPAAVEPPPIEEPEPIEAEPVEPEPSEPEPAQPPQLVEANGYSKSGPGPMAALRFRWTVRQDGAQYYVDETVGEGSTPLVSGPMDGDAAIKFVDAREAEARQRFEHFKHEMLSRAATAIEAAKDGDEA
ncbi:hypothetical protein [Bradyrhizobium sp. USDA 3364]